jgi:hypothetical protein
MDEIMNKMMDRMLLTFLLSNRELGNDFAMVEVSDHIMDRMLVRALLEERQKSS